MESFDLPHMPSRAATLEVTSVEGGFAAYVPETDRVHHLNHTGAFILEVCDGQHTVDDIIEITKTMFDLEHPPSDEVRGFLRVALAERMIL